MWMVSELCFGIKKRLNHTWSGISPSHKFSNRPLIFLYSESLLPLNFQNRLLIFLYQLINFLCNLEYSVSCLSVYIYSLFINNIFHFALLVGVPLPFYNILVYYDLKHWENCAKLTWHQEQNAMRKLSNKSAMNTTKPN